MSAGTLRLLLIAFLFAMYILALLYLRGRSLTGRQFAIWALIALLIPIVGPLFTILVRPGERRFRRVVPGPYRRR